MLDRTYQLHARYNRWINQRIFAVLDNLPDEQRRKDLGAYFGSIHQTLNHILLADYIWMWRLVPELDLMPRDQQGAAIEITALNQQLFNDFAELNNQRSRLDEALVSWTDTLDPAVLARTVHYKRKGQEQSHPLFWALSHLFSHQTHHRGQVTAMMTRLGADPGVTDLIAYLREHHG